MDKILQLRQEREAKINEMRGLLETAKTEKRDLTEEEEGKYKSLESRAAETEKEIDDLEKRKTEREEREARLSEREKTLETVDTRVQPANMTTTPAGVAMPSGNEPESGFRNFGEFLATIVSNRADQRLQRFIDSRSDQQMGVGGLGGYMIPDQFRQEIMSVPPQEAIVRPRATVLPAGDPPDGKLTIAALDQSSNYNMYGGVTIYHQGEKSTLQQSTANLREVTLEPKKLTGYMVCTNDLLANWQAASGFCTTQMRLAMIGAEDYDFLRGNGANRSRGIVSAPCSIVYSRATASQIAYADILGMLARVKFGGPLIWIASQTTMPQLGAITDGTNNILVKNAAESMPMTLMGYPLLFNDRSPALGSKGDLILAALRSYLIKQGSGPRVDVSREFLFDTDRTCFRIVWHVDGRPWLNKAIPLEGSSSDTVSPFVVLE